MKKLMPRLFGFVRRVLGDSIAIIFHRPLPAIKRRFWVSALMPYLFILIVAAGLILITFANAFIDASGQLGQKFPQLNDLIHHHDLQHKADSGLPWHRDPKDDAGVSASR